MLNTANEKINQSRRLTRQSITLSFLVVTLFIVSISTIVLVSIDTSRYATLVNDTGRIRGGIQRLIKLELIGIKDEALIERIDSLLVGSRYIESKRLIKIFNRVNFKELLAALDDRWKTLKDEIILYRKNEIPSNILVKDSETLWVLSNDLVSSIEATSHLNIALYYIVSVVILVCVFSFGFLLMMTKYSIKMRTEFLADHDELTGLYNRHFFNHAVEREYAISSRKGRLFYILMCDIDFFKNVNDKYGHDVGDDVLKSVAKSLNINSRESDLVARFGGEEFIILAVEETKEYILKYAERLRSSIENLEINKGIKVTISIGISCYSAGLLPNEIIKNADVALYKAKETGRNKVVHY